MLGLSFNFRIFNRLAHSLILLGSLAVVPVQAKLYWEPIQSTPKHFEQEWISRYFSSIDEDTELGEVVDFLVMAREAIVAKGYECPTLMEMAIGMKNYLVSQGIEVDEEEIQEIYEEIYFREQLVHHDSAKLSTRFSKPSFELCKHKNKDKKSKKEVKMKSRSAFGFLKCVAGGLICLIPLPAVQAVGAGLVLNGINDLIDDAREQGDENERLEKLDEQRRQEAALEQKSQ